MKQYLYLIILLCFSVSVNAQNEMEFLSKVYYPDGLSSIWGYTTNGVEYALVGVKSGLSIVDLSTPTEPQEVAFVPGPFNVWREIKTWQHYAYVTNELDEGVLIADLSNLPNSVDTLHFTYNGKIKTAHTVWVDEFGYLYIMGYRDYAGTTATNQRGVLMFDLNPDPLHPQYVGEYTANYVHDAYVRNNIMYTAEIYAGVFAVVDVSDKQNPVILATQTTPSAFAHNVWLSDNSQFAFVADERNDAYLTSYDISDFGDIRELDRYQAAPNTNAMPHNAHVFDDFVVLSYYTEGMKIIDAHEPDALVETEFYDTSPFSGPGSAGCWGVYPYFESGILIGSDRQEGMYVVRPTYQRAAYVSGTITDASTGTTIPNVYITINNTAYTDSASFSGTYKMGVANAGVYDITFYQYGYLPYTANNVTLNSGEITNLNIALQPATAFAIQADVRDLATGLPIEGVLVEVSNSNQLTNGQWNTSTQQTTTTGIATWSDRYPDHYRMVLHKWGYRPQIIDDYWIDNANNTVTVYLERGYYDDFYQDLGWTVESSNNAVGSWVRLQAIGANYGDVICTPYSDSETDFGNICYTTGNTTGIAENSDLDNTTTSLVSPIFDVSSYSRPTIHFRWWYCNFNAAASNVRILLSTDTNAQPIDFSMQPNFSADSSNLSHWIDVTMEIPNNMRQFIIEASNTLADGVTEMTFDTFEIGEGTTGIPSANNNNNLQIIVSPNPFSETLTVHCLQPQQQPQTATLYNSLGQALANTTFSTGINTWEWGKNLPNGTYFLQIGNTTDGYQHIPLVKQ
ncbi:MAG: choice-of-anchor B family protein [Chitinophagales bacterium]|nr:choice-of-anchor B family protein [Chitinophagales bacterium]